MPHLDGSLDVSLRRQGLFSLPDAAHVTIRCCSGSVWITLDGETADIVLEAGESFTTPQHRRALIYGLKPACLNLRAQRAARRAQVPGRLVLEQLLG